MNREKTREYYKELKQTELCSCNYCKNYYKEVEKTYPDLKEYLKTLGISIEKPFETMPLEVDEKGEIEYINIQYIVLGKKDDFHPTRIKDVEVKIATSHPSVDMKEEHFVIELGPIKLRWVMGREE
ncbi:hypothetical protein [Guggenheimella bovis]